MLNGAGPRKQEEAGEFLYESFVLVLHVPEIIHTLLTLIKSLNSHPHYGMRVEYSVALTLMRELRGLCREQYASFMQECPSESYASVFVSKLRNIQTQLQNAFQFHQMSKSTMCPLPVAYSKFIYHAISYICAVLAYLVTMPSVLLDSIDIEFEPELRQLIRTAKSKYFIVKELAGEENLVFARTNAIYKQTASTLHETLTSLNEAQSFEFKMLDELIKSFEKHRECFNFAGAMEWLATHAAVREKYKSTLWFIDNIVRGASNTAKGWYIPELRPPSPSPPPSPPLSTFSSLHSSMSNRDSGYSHGSSSFSAYD